MSDAPQRLIELADAFSGTFDPQELAARFGLDSNALSLHCLIASTTGTVKTARADSGCLLYVWNAPPENALEFAEHVLRIDVRSRLAR